MATQKKNKYIEQDLEWLEAKLEEHKAFIDARPISLLKDRKGTRPSKWGASEYIIASIEKQREDLSKALVEYSQILAIIKDLREDTAKKKMLTRGNEELTPFESGQIRH